MITESTHPLNMAELTQRGYKKKGRELALDPLEVDYEELRFYSELNTSGLLSFPFRYGQT